MQLLRFFVTLLDVIGVERKITVLETDGREVQWIIARDNGELTIERIKECAERS